MSNANHYRSYPNSKIISVTKQENTPFWQVQWQTPAGAVRTHSTKIPNYQQQVGAKGTVVIYIQPGSKNEYFSGVRNVRRK